MIAFPPYIFRSTLILTVEDSKYGHRTPQLDPQPSQSQQERALHYVGALPNRSEWASNYLLEIRTQKNPDDVVITLAIRTPLTKGFKGGMKDTPLDFMVYTVLKQVLEKSRIDPQMIEDVCLGNVSRISFGCELC